MLLVTSCWVPCDGLASHPGGVVMLLVTSCWVPCDGLASHPGGVVILLVTSCWVPCDGLASHPGGSSNTPSCFMLGTLWWTSIPSRGSSNTPSCLWPGCIFTYFLTFIFLCRFYHPRIRSCFTSWSLKMSSCCLLKCLSLESPLCQPRKRLRYS